MQYQDWAFDRCVEWQRLVDTVEVVRFSQKQTLLVVRASASRSPLRPWLSAWIRSAWPLFGGLRCCGEVNLVTGAAPVIVIARSNFTVGLRRANCISTTGSEQRHSKFADQHSTRIPLDSEERRNILASEFVDLSRAIISQPKFHRLSAALV